MTAAETDHFESILARNAATGPAAADETLHDLALDQVFARVGADSPYSSAAFRTPLSDETDVEYRQGVFHALEDARLRAIVETFLSGMGECVRADEETANAHYRYGLELWHLTAVAGYVATVEAFHAGLSETVPQLERSSTGWELLAQHVAAHRSSSGFEALRDEATRLRQRIAALEYNALIRGGKVTIAPFDDEPDLGQSVAATFARFRQGEAGNYSEPVRAGGMDHVQAWMLELVAKLHPEPFAELARFTAASRDYRDAALTSFADEVRFYLVYLDYLAPLRNAGLPVCYPVVSASSKELAATDTWDVVLAPQLVAREQPVITNDLTLTGAERILVISGPNQGGKTTAARTFGQLHYLAGIGCPIPGEKAKVFLCDRVLTVFEREERLDAGKGRLGAEIERLHDVFQTATERTVIVINEAFASTALHDARILTRDVLERISGLDALAVCVTFVDELSRLNDKTVSMVSAVDLTDPAVRTFRLERRRADGLAYARALAAKHGLTLEQIAQRLSDHAEAGTAR